MKKIIIIISILTLSIIFVFSQLPVRTKTDRFMINDTLFLNWLQNSGYFANIISEYDKWIEDSSNYLTKNQGRSDIEDSINLYRDENVSGYEWVSQLSPGDSNYRCVCYGNNMFVGFAYAATASNSPSYSLITSYDGVSWTLRELPVTNNWYNCCYGNGLFVAVSNNTSWGEIATSSDGINWDIINAPVTNDLRGVCYANNIFVITCGTGSCNRVLTSNDGRTWTARTTPANNKWQSVTWGNDIFVAVSDDGLENRVMTSVDGITWTTRSTAEMDYNWGSVTYGNGYFTAVSSNGTDNRVMTSPNGILWTLQNTAKVGRSVCYGNGIFVSPRDTRIGISKNGSSWEMVTPPSSNNWYGCAFGNNMFVSVANSGSGNRIMSSGKILSQNSPSNNLLQGGLTIKGANINLNAKINIVDADSTQLIIADSAVFYDKRNIKKGIELSNQFDYNFSDYSYITKKWIKDSLIGAFEFNFAEVIVLDDNVDTLFLLPVKNNEFYIYYGYLNFQSVAATLNNTLLSAYFISKEWGVYDWCQMQIDTLILSTKNLGTLSYAGVIKTTCDDNLTLETKITNLPFAGNIVCSTGKFVILKIHFYTIEN